MKKIGSTLGILSFFIFLVGSVSSADIEKITGTVQESGMLFGIGLYIKLEEAPDKQFVMTDEQATKVGAMKIQSGAVMVSSLKGQKMTILYDNTLNEKYGRKYFMITSLEK